MSSVEMLGGSEKIWVVFLEVRIKKSMLYWGLYWGPAIQVNYHVGVGFLNSGVQGPLKDTVWWSTSP